MIIISISMLGKAAHIIGGEMSYECLGNDQYRITTKVYKDAEKGADLDGFISLNIFDENNNFVETHTSYDSSLIEYNYTLKDKCDPTNDLTVNSQYGTYISIITIDNPEKGHIIAFSRCCSDEAIANLEEDQGMTVSVFIPANTVVECNNSPFFTGDAPNFVCLNEDNTFDFAATDIDGDVLKYEICGIFHGRDPSQARQDSTVSDVLDFPPFEYVQYTSGFSGIQPFGSNFTINETTGRITGIPTMQGYFSIGVCVKEYRNGVLISTVYRYVSILVRPCDMVAFDELPNGKQGYGTNGCLTYNFLNHSIGGNKWEWNFGDGTAISSDENPIHVYGKIGEYDVTLIVIDTDRDCRDTAVVSLKVDVDASVDFDVNVDCLVDGTSFTDRSVWPIPLNTAEKQWIFGDKIDTIITDRTIPTHKYEVGGVYKVGLVVKSEECGIGAAYKTIFVPNTPVADFEIVNDTIVVSEPILIKNNSKNSSTTTWEFGDGDMSYEEGIDINHTYDASGEYLIKLTVANPQMTECTDEQTLKVKLTNFALDFPTAFTPNGDNVNDEFTYIIGGIKDISFKIFNRWGEVVYESTNSSDAPWDGTSLKNGKELPSGTYTYLLTGISEDFDTEIEPKRGYINLLR